MTLIPDSLLPLRIYQKRASSTLVPKRPTDKINIPDPSRSLMYSSELSSKVFHQQLQKQDDIQVKFL